MAEVAGAVLYAAKNLAEGAVLLAKGIYDPTLPLKAHLRPITSLDVRLAYHTISVIKGRAYLFGGMTTATNSSSSSSSSSTSASTETVLADNDVRIIILSSSGFAESVDFKLVKATADAPPSRFGHSAAVIDDCVYIFGGAGEDGEPLDENGRVWIYDTLANSWTHLDPAEGTSYPGARTSHASVASEHPRPERRQLPSDFLPQQPPDPEKTLPDIPDANTYGTILIQGGRSKSGNNLVDTWAFDVAKRTWKELPEQPGPSTPSPSLALVDQRLYTFSSGQVSFLDLDSSSTPAQPRELSLAPLRPWQSLPPSSSSPSKSYPGERHSAPMIPITTGQGRQYLLLLGGLTPHPPPSALEDIWTLQLPPENLSAAIFKDRVRETIKKGTREAEWEEVKYHDGDGVMIQESQEGRGIGLREGFAAAKAPDLDGESVVLWGGIGSDGRIRGDGLIVSIET